MPRCPLHPDEQLEPKKKGWFCEECGAIVLGYERYPRESSPKAEHKPAPPPHADLTPTTPLLSTKDALPADKLSTETIVAESSIRTRSTLRALSSASFSDDWYGVRAGVDEVFRAAVSRPRRAVMVVGDSGTGKTALLARLASVLVNGQPLTAPARKGSVPPEAPKKSPTDAVLFIPGQALTGEEEQEAAEVLKHAVFLAAGIDQGAFDSLQDLWSHLTSQEPGPHVLWLLLDGLDDSPKFAAVMAHLQEQGETLRRHPWLRLVVTLRRSAYEALSLHANDDTSTASLSQTVWADFWDFTRGRTVPYLLVHPWLRQDEMSAAWEAKHSQLTESVPYEALPPHVLGLLRNPLSMEMFLRAFREQDTPPASLDTLGLMDAYLDVLADETPVLERAMTELGELMLEQRSTEIASSLLDGSSKERDDTSAVQQFITRTRLLVPFPSHHPGKVAAKWGFRHQRIAEQLLARTLLRKLGPQSLPSAADINRWAWIAAGTRTEPAFPALAGALELLVDHWASRAEFGFVRALAAVENDDIRFRLLFSLFSALGPVWEFDDDASDALTEMLDLLWAEAVRKGAVAELLHPARAAATWLVQNGLTRAASHLHRHMFRMLGAVRTSPGHKMTSRILSAWALDIADLAKANGDQDDARLYLAHAADQLEGDSWETNSEDDTLSQQAQVHLDHAQILRNRSDLKAAAKVIEQAVRLVAQSPTDDAPLPAKQLDALVSLLLASGELEQDRGRDKHALDTWEEALRAAQASIGERPHSLDMRKNQARILLGLAQTQFALSKLSDARETFGAAVKTLNRLTRREPQRADLDELLAVALESQSLLLRATHEEHLACTALEDAAGVMLALVDMFDNRHDWRFQLMTMLDDLGVLLRQVGDDLPARTCLEDSAQHARHLIEQDAWKDETRPVLANVLMSLLLLDKAEQRRFEARRHVREAIKVLREWGSHQPSVEATDRLATALTELGFLASEDDDPDEARKHFSEAILALSADLAQNPGNGQLHWTMGRAINGLASLQNGGAKQLLPSHRFSVVVSEKGSQRVREFYEKAEIAIGRAPGNDLMLPNYAVSRHHATVRLREDGFFIRDLGSTHGTRINGTRIEESAVARPGDRVELGDFVLVFAGPSIRQTGNYTGEREGVPTGYPPPVATKEETTLSGDVLVPLTDETEEKPSS